MPAQDTPPGNDTSHANQATEARTPAQAQAQAQARARARARLLVAVVPAVLLMAVAVWEIVAAARAGHDVPGERAWQQAAQAVRERHRAGDLIVFAPDWIDPIGRMHLGDLIPVDMAARMDDARYGTVWELAIRGASAPESRGRQVAWSHDFGGVRVRKLVAEPAEVVTDFVAAFEPKQAPKQARAPGQPHVRVQGPSVGRPRVVLAEVGFEPHRCVQVEPRPDQTVRVIYENVALGSRLVGYAGLADVFTRRDIRDPGRIEVLIDGQQVAGARFGVDDGWVGFSAATTPGVAEVEFRATAVGAGAHKRLICFAAEARK